MPTSWRRHPGAGAIAVVGTYHCGGPFIEKQTLAPQFGHPVLDAPRLLVASTSN